MQLKKEILSLADLKESHEKLKVDIRFQAYSLIINKTKRVLSMI